MARQLPRQRIKVAAGCSPDLAEVAPAAEVPEVAPPAVETPVVATPAARNRNQPAANATEPHPVRMRLIFGEFRLKKASW